MGDPRLPRARQDLRDPAARRWRRRRQDHPRGDGGAGRPRGRTSTRRGRGACTSSVLRIGLAAADADDSGPTSWPRRGAAWRRSGSWRRSSPDAAGADARGVRRHPGPRRPGAASQTGRRLAPFRGDSHSEGSAMRKSPLIVAATAATALVLAACRGGSDCDDPPARMAPSGGCDATVTSKDVDGVGRVLVDPTGRALYAADQEADGDRALRRRVHVHRAPARRRVGLRRRAPGGRDARRRHPPGRHQAGDGGAATRSTRSRKKGRGRSPAAGSRHAFGDQSFLWHAVLAGGTSAGGTGGSPSCIYSY